MAAPVHYLALGDSYTIGEGVAEHECWPVQLAAQLRAQGVPVDPPRIIATSGWTTDALSSAIDAAEQARSLLPRYDLVTLGIGVNDQYRGRALGDYALAFRMLLERAIALAGGKPCHVLVPSIPDWGTTPFARSSDRDCANIAERIDAFNAVAAAVCAQRGVTFIDVTRIGRRDENLALLVDDGLHPSAALYRQWVAHLVGAASAAIASRG